MGKKLSTFVSFTSLKTTVHLESTVEQTDHMCERRLGHATVVHHLHMQHLQSQGGCETGLHHTTLAVRHH